MTKQDKKIIINFLFELIGSIVFFIGLFATVYLFLLFTYNL